MAGDGTVWQRHTPKCPRTTDADGKTVFRKHKCKGSWAFYLLAGRDPATGRRRQITRSGYATAQAAKDALKDARDRIAVSGGRSEGVTVAEYLESWLAQKRNLRAGTLKGYREHIERHLVPILDPTRKVRLTDLTPEDIDGLLDTLSDAERERPLSTATVRRIHATLRNALNSAVRRRYITFNPALMVELPAETRGHSAAWTSAQAAQFLDSASSDRLYALWHLALVSGLRRGELLAVRLDDLDLTKGVLYVAESLVEVGGVVRVESPKTRNGVRVVALDPGTVAVLKAHLAQRASEKLSWGTGWVESGRVFTRENGSAIRPGYASRRFVSLTTQAKLPRIRMHDLRHTSATIGLDAGVSTKVMSVRLAHSTTKITADIYQHVHDAAAHEAAAKIAGAISSLRRKAG